MPRAVTATAETADGWIPMLYVPELADRVWAEPLKAGLASRPAGLGALDVVAGGMVAIGEDLDAAALRDALRPFIALYVGGMGAPGKNFYNDIADAYGGLATPRGRSRATTWPAASARRRPRFRPGCSRA
jgi:hypothetical protein